MNSYFKPNRIYAVAGASNNQDKFGYKVLKWYSDRNLPVIPINPKNEEILGLKSVSDISSLLDKHPDIGLNVVTAPKVTYNILQEISAKAGKDGFSPVKAILFQPGTYDADVIALANKTVPLVIQDCVLRSGDHFLSKL